MTDARLPGRWLFAPQLDRLSDAAFRLFMNGLMYAAEQGTDGALERRALRYLHPDGFDAAAAAELVAAELWSVAGDGYQVGNWTETQTPAAQVAQTRENNRQKAQRHRDRAKAAQRPSVTSDTTTAATGRVTGHAAGQERTGQDRQDDSTQPPRELAHAHAGARTSRVGDSDASRFCRHNVPRDECTYGDPACRAPAALSLVATPY